MLLLHAHLGRFENTYTPAQMPVCWPAAHGGHEESESPLCLDTRESADRWMEGTEAPDGSEMQVHS